MASDNTAQNNEGWASRFGLILAMAGNAVGLGNFLRFPVQAVQNGGGAFIIPYIVCFIVLGIPLMISEWAMGKYGGGFGFNSPPFVMKNLDKHRIWKYIGGLGLFANVIIASYYCYIESWTMSYVIHSIAGTFRGMNEVIVSNFFDKYLDVATSTTGIPYEAVVFYLLCLALNVWILSKGLQGGIEKVSKICVPLLIVFGLFLSIKAVTLKVGVDNAVYPGYAGLNFLWTPDFTSLLDPKVWLAAAGQIFFTLSLGMGCIMCYSSYLKKKDDIVLNSLTTSFLNEFCEIIIGSAMVIPIAVGYFGVDKVVELSKLGGLGLGFRALPFLFENWGPVMATLSGVAFFGLLFFAGITSSIAMGSPIIAFFKDGFSLNRKKSSLIFGLIILIYGLPTVLFFQKGVFDEYDYWGGTIILFIFAMFESILFSWVIGIDKGWKMINEGADMKLPSIFKFFLKYITPTLLIIIFLSALIKPKNEDWSKLCIQGWEVDKTSLIGVLSHKDIGPNHKWITDHYYSEYNGTVRSIEESKGKKLLNIYSSDNNVIVKCSDNNVVQVSQGDYVNVGDVLYSGKVINNVFYIDCCRISLLLIFIVIVLMIKRADLNIERRENK